jgi:hypothetical protein
VTVRACVALSPPVPEAVRVSVNVVEGGVVWLPPPLPHPAARASGIMARNIRPKPSPSPLQSAHGNPQDRGSQGHQERHRAAAKAGSRGRRLYCDGDRSRRNGRSQSHRRRRAASVAGRRARAGEADGASKIRRVQHQIEGCRLAGIHGYEVWLPVAAANCKAGCVAIALDSLEPGPTPAVFTAATW